MIAFKIKAVHLYKKKDYRIQDKDLNRLKVVLTKKKRTNKWLAEQLGKDPGTGSKWCTNTCQPDLKSFVKIVQLLEVDMSEFVRLS